jgi:hypothetical protein
VAVVTDTQERNSQHVADDRDVDRCGVVVSSASISVKGSSARAYRDQGRIGPIGQCFAVGEDQDGGGLFFN